jgi:predicted PhzF superfamily epimerase YddE/YHI9
MDFPAQKGQPAEPPAGLLAALGVEAVAVSRIRFDYLVEVASEEIVRRTAPGFGSLLKVEARGIIVTARADSDGFDFVSRFFGPAVGVDEDPVTGSAHCALAPYWGERLNKREMTGYQASARGGVVRVRWNGDRVVLGGQAVTVMTGDLRA